MTPLQTILGMGTVPLHLRYSVQLVVAVLAFSAAFALRRRRWVAGPVGFLWIGSGVLLDLIATSTAPSPQFRDVLAATGVIGFLCGLVKIALDAVEYLSRRVRQHFSTILRDIIALLLYAGIIVAVLAGAFGVNVSSLLASLGVLTVVAGLALQETLGNVFSGLALQLQRPFSPGDWIRTGTFVGRVQGIGFRSTTVMTLANERLEIPNSTIGKDVLVNYGGPPVAEEITVGISYGEPPNRVREAILQAIHDVPHVLQEPAPDVLAWEYGDSAIKYRVKYWLVDYAYREQARASLVTRLWYALKRNSMEIPYPIQTLELRRDRIRARPQSQFEAEIIHELQEVDFLRNLSDTELRVLVPYAQRNQFGAGETLLREGEQGDALFLIRRGTVEILLKTPDGGMRRVNTLTRPAFIGEQSMLTGAPRNATVRALTDTEILELNRVAFTELFKQHPEAVAQISEVISARSVENKEMLAALGSNGAASERRNWLVGKIREIFDL
jgi:small-conductance mechanosensitive channel/CRP-like cAMP-binding protein